MQSVELLHEKLRRLAVEDPREARKIFLQLFDSSDSILEQFLGQISSPADGRLRHLVASALRNNRDKERLAPYLIVWYEIETDEFAKRAMAAALDGIKSESSSQTTLAREVARLTAPGTYTNWLSRPTVFDVTIPARSRTWRCLVTPCLVRSRPSAN